MALHESDEQFAVRIQGAAGASDNVPVSSTVWSELAPIDACTSLVFFAERALAKKPLTRCGARMPAFLSAVHRRWMEQSPRSPTADSRAVLATIFERLLEHWAVPLDKRQSQRLWTPYAYAMLLKASILISQCDSGLLSRICASATVNPCHMVALAGGLKCILGTSKHIGVPQRQPRATAVDVACSDTVTVRLREAFEQYVGDASIDPANEDSGFILALATVAPYVDWSPTPVLTTRVLARALLHAIDLDRGRADARGREVVHIAHATAFGRAASLVTTPSFVVHSVHGALVEQPRASREQRLALLRLTAGALSGRARALAPDDAVVSLDALSLLHVAVTNPPSTLFLDLANRVASDGLAVERLVSLTTAVLVPAAAKRPREVFLLYATITVLAMSRHTSAASPTAVKLPDEDRVAHWHTFLRQLLAYLSNISKRPDTDVMALQHVVLEACVALFSGAPVDQEVRISMAFQCWRYALNLCGTRALPAAALARLLDTMVSSPFSRANVAEAFNLLRSRSADWSDALARRASAILAMRATLRCDPKHLDEVLRHALVLIQREGLTAVARDAVLKADLERQDQMLRWYFLAVSPANETQLPGGPSRYPPIARSKL